MRKVLKSLAQFCSGLRFRLLLLVSLVCAPLVALTLHTTSEDHRRAIAGWPQRARKIAQVVSHDEEALILQTRQLLLAVAESSSARTMHSAGCKMMLDPLLAGSPRIKNLGILNTNCELVASALPVAGFVPMRRPHLLAPANAQLTSPAAPFKGSRVLLAPHDDGSRLTALTGAPNADLATDQDRPGSTAGQRNLAARRYVQTLDPDLDWESLPLGRLLERTLQTRSFAVGDLTIEDQCRTITFGYPIFGLSGEPQAVAFATLDCADPFGSDVPPQLVNGASWVEIDPGGQIVFHYSESKARQGPVPNVSLAKASLQGSAKPVEILDSRGVPILYAFAARQSQFTPAPLICVLSIPKTILFADGNRLLLRNLIWLAIAALLALALGWFGGNLLIVRPLRAMAKVTARLAAGDFTARAGGPHGHDELGGLISSFDQMAETLEQREFERKHNSHKLQTLSYRVVEIQETERRHIARELHDEIGQSLTLAEMNLRAALKNPGTPALARRLQASVQAVERVLEQVQDLALNLRPSLLDDLGLGPALQRYTQRQATLAGLQARLRIEPMENRLEPLIETECFRITQEALTNIIRHANARTVMIELTQEDGHLHLCVRDDGAGFDVKHAREAAHRGASLGLLGMEERAALAGGILELDSCSGEGTRVDAWFPLKWRADSLAE